MGDKYMNWQGIVGEVVEMNKIKMVQVRDTNGKITQTIVARKLDIKKFKKIEA